MATSDRDEAADQDGILDSPPAPATVKLQRHDTNTIAEAAAAVADEAMKHQTSNVSTSNGITAKDEASALQGLTEDVRNQDDLERDITSQANQLMIEKEDELDQKRIDRVKASIQRYQSKKRALERRLVVDSEIAELEASIVMLENDIKDIQGRIDARHQYEPEGRREEAEVAGGNKRLPNESQRDFLIRTGKITPFSRMPRRVSQGLNGDLTEALMDAEEEADEDLAEGISQAEPRSHQNLRLPGFADTEPNQASAAQDEFSLRPRKRRRILDDSLSRSQVEPTTSEASDGEFAPGTSEAAQDLVEGDNDDDDEDAENDGLMTSRTSEKRPRADTSIKNVDLTKIDDGNEILYQARLREWVERRSTARAFKKEQDDIRADEVSWEAEEEEWFRVCPDAPDHQFDNGIKLPGDIYPALFDYQKTGVQWLGELYSQSVGGIIGDEMGLGKTIQVISFLAALHYSKKMIKPVIIVAPATVLQQWVNEFHRWWPPLRVSILHSTGSGMLNIGNEHRLEEDEDGPTYGRGQRMVGRNQAKVKRIVDRVVRHGHVLVTTYAGLQTYSHALIDVDWEYAVLDEGHKIRNPNTAITIYCKELRTSNRIILSGTPMQNDLKELWSLFDFVFPMRLGTLVNFRQTFEDPIKIGGYANASNLQVLTATKCAETLKEAISPYLLQRLKVDVASDLPPKREQVLFCKLTKPQREAYEVFLASDEMKSILARTRQSLYGIDILRKICNHPDLLDPRLRGKPGYKWGNPHKSGKMQVVKALLEMWKSFGHKTLLFSQGVQMLNIIEHFVKGLDGFKYLRMDGSTNVKERQDLVDRFNNDPDLHVFLLTTKVGGLGVNLTGANRVIIFDPDWNPSTDVQARERAWRLGQKREVIIYRLMTAGTIEEKIYHRQIFKQFLTNKILKDPKQRQTFQMKELHDLFTLGGSENGITETGEMFEGTEVQFAPISNTLSPLSNGETTTAPSLQGDAHTEILNFTGVSGLENFRNEEDATPDSESRLMSGIFARSGVHSALEHDEIINGKKVIRADRHMIDQEAKKVAAEAAAELRKAGEIARTLEPGVVTWTGEFGSAGRPVNIRRGIGPASTGILAGLANRQGLYTANASGSSNSSRSVTPAVDRGPRGKDFIKLIKDFISRQGGSAPTQALVNHFNRTCKTAQQTAEFKHILQEIAVLDKSSNSRLRGKWMLKEEFK